jgi:hypothetical protein
VTPDSEYRLEHVEGNVEPNGVRPDLSGFALLKQGDMRLAFLIAGLAAFVGGLLVRCGTRTGRHRWDWQNVLGQLIGWPLMLGSLILLGFVAAYAAGQSLHVEPGLVFTSSVLEAKKELSITVSNLEATAQSGTIDCRHNGFS